MVKSKSDLKFHDVEHKSVYEYMLLIKYNLLDRKLSKIVNYQRVYSDF